jgi:hypothetical protein
MAKSKAKAILRRMYVTKIVNDLLTEERPFILTQLQDAILNTEQFTLDEWVDLYDGLQRITTLKPHIDLIIKLRKENDDHPEQTAANAN